MGVLEIMDPVRGDEKLEWDPAKPKSVEKAREVFERKIKEEGFTAYAAKLKVEEKWVRGKKITEFNPDRGRILLAAPLTGGPTMIARAVPN